jgi:hypothetical protein
VVPFRRICKSSLWDYKFISGNFTILKPEYEGHLNSSGTDLSTSSRNFVDVKLRSLFPSISFGKRCTSYNVPPTSRKVPKIVSHQL